MQIRALVTTRHHPVRARHCLPSHLTVKKLNFFCLLVHEWTNELTYLGNIKCEFQEDYCEWTTFASNEASGFAFQRQTSSNLEANFVPGPDLSHLGSKDDFFVFLTPKGVTEGEQEYVELKSAVFIGKLHPSECFQFWFNFQVRYDPWPIIIGSYNLCLALQEAEGIERLDLIRVSNDIEETIWSLNYDWSHGSQTSWQEGRIQLLAKDEEGYEYMVCLYDIADHNAKDSTYFLRSNSELKEDTVKMAFWLLTTRCFWKSTLNVTQSRVRPCPRLQRPRPRLRHLRQLRRQLSLSPQAV